MWTYGASLEPSEGAKLKPSYHPFVDGDVRRGPLRRGHRRSDDPQPGDRRASGRGPVRDAGRRGPGGHRGATRPRRGVGHAVGRGARAAAPARRAGRRGPGVRAGRTRDTGHRSPDPAHPRRGPARGGRAGCSPPPAGRTSSRTPATARRRVRRGSWARSRRSGACRRRSVSSLPRWRPGTPSSSARTRMPHSRRSCSPRPPRRPVCRPGC